jgi:NarL family two-component system sensor histidine kinase LiaS
LITELRPAALEGTGWAGALQEYLGAWSQHACIPADFQVKNGRPLPFDIEQALFRVAQEALANVARHSRASAASITFEATPETAHLEIHDNGVGFDPEAKGQPADQKAGFGLQSMRERIAALGGAIRIDSLPGNGATIKVIIPIPKETP